MRSTLLRCGWVPVLLLLVACGSSGDDDGVDSDAAAGAEPTTASSTSAKGANDKSRGADITDAQYGHGKVQVQVSGDKEATFGGDGTGFAKDGFALLTYGSRDAAVILSFSNKAGDGTVSLTTNDYAGSWELDKACKLNAKQSGTTFEGDFSCEKVEAVSPTSAKAYKISLKGSFTAEP